MENVTKEQLSMGIIAGCKGRSSSRCLEAPLPFGPPAPIASVSGWLDWYNTRRSHRALGHRPPIVRVNELNNLGSNS
jgi:transposase InsO family protein